MKITDIIFIVVFNCIPVAGVFFWGWQFDSIILFYCLETSLYAVSSAIKCAYINTQRGTPEKFSRENVTGVPEVIVVLSLMVTGFISSFFQIKSMVWLQVAGGLFALIPYLVFSYYHDFIGNRECETISREAVVMDVLIRILIVVAIVIAAACVCFATSDKNQQIDFQGYRILIMVFAVLKIFVETHIVSSNMAHA
ncbi:MAG TPA: DUF6498-containing protein [Candidatus Omnitrophota bacterium]|nr:DUF6498-containing protein [Candidatus Omnitrophota bacterium]HPT07240.1 DUF6498-containing protein [Candidatus Omnitrophota bacterium]